ncbi:hypothetical protein AXF42_Ash021159 [Apostasia shenzhenica]|uniref:Uncharacterized protein n=1 Tax=Apostasia shenzhenica TaxID=1088818 RepID=A0A2I0A914_9ASPA|nr:hypothetical protein AXF42_Ash021159 [Apostasia shenzhenica]
MAAAINSRSPRPSRSVHVSPSRYPTAGRGLFCGKQRESSDRTAGDGGSASRRCDKAAKWCNEADRDHRHWLGLHVQQQLTSKASTTSFSGDQMECA